ncbi:MAG: DUF3459 domain-containing protein, partial [Chloroflexales bacterium]
PALRAESLGDLETTAGEAARTLALTRRSAGDEVWIGLNFGPDPADLPPPAGDWQTLLDSADMPGGNLAPYSFRLLRRIPS